MFDPNSIQSEELANRIKNIPKGTKDFLTSPAFAEKLNEIGEKYGLLQEIEQNEILEQVIALLAAGLIKLEELEENLEGYLYLDHETAVAISREMLTALKPILPTQALTPAFSSSFTGQAPVVQQPAPTVPKISENTAFNNAKGVTFVVPKELPLQTPVPTPTISATVNKITSQARNDNSPAPFIIHERSATQPTVVPASGFGASRPTFIRPQFTPSTNSGQAPTVARVQFGEQVIGKQGVTTPKIVNYNAPRIQSEQTELRPQVLKTTNEPIKNDENTINLRDLPR